MNIQVLDVQYSDKTSKLLISAFNTVPSILPSQQHTLSPSGLPADTIMIMPNKTPIRYTTESPSKKLLGCKDFYQVKILAGNNHRPLVQSPLC